MCFPQMIFSLTSPLQCSTHHFCDRFSLHTEATRTRLLFSTALFLISVKLKTKFTVNYLLMKLKDCISMMSKYRDSFIKRNYQRDVFESCSCSSFAQWPCPVSVQNEGCGTSRSKLVRSRSFVGEWETLGTTFTPGTSQTSPSLWAPLPHLSHPQNPPDVHSQWPEVPSRQKCASV